MFERYHLNTDTKFEFDGKYWNGSGSITIKTFDTDWQTTEVTIPPVIGRTLEEAQDNLLKASDKATGADKLRLELQALDDAMLKADAPLVG